MRIQVFGPNGMLGSAVVKAIGRRGHVWESNHADLEIVMPGHIHAPVVINCAGLVKQRQYRATRFMLINAYGPHHLAAACDTAHARLIHVSTDCLFADDGPHSESAPPDVYADVYARSKWAGEVGAPHLTIRTSFVGFGPRGLLADLGTLPTVRASDHLLWSGHTVDTIADLLITLAERADVTGLLHIPGEFQTRYQLCQRLVARYELPARIIRDDEYMADRRLVSIRYAALGLPELPDFGAQIEGMAPNG